MNKKVLLFLSCYGLSLMGFSQESGVVSYTITNNWIKRYAACDYIPKADRERMAYVWSGDDNEWEVKAELKFNPTEYRFEYKEDDENNKWRKGDDYIIYRNREQGESFDVQSLLNRQYVVQDSIVCQTWKIKNDLKEIAGRICMNAAYFDSIKGKEVVAWFALDFPVSIGPDKYCGLPGIILEVNEANGAKVYTATHILLSEEKIEIEKPNIKKKRKAITNREYNDIVNKYIVERKKMQQPYFWGIPF